MQASDIWAGIHLALAVLLARERPANTKKNQGSQPEEEKATDPQSLAGL